MTEVAEKTKREQDKDKAINIDTIKLIVESGNSPESQEAVLQWTQSFLEGKFMNSKMLGKKFFKKEDIKKVTTKEIKVIMEAGKRSPRAREAAVLWILDLLEWFSIERINKTGRIYGAEFDELLEAAKEAVIKNYDKYDPDRAKPTSFFLPYIDEYTKAECRFTNPSSPYYINMRTKLNQVAQENGFESMMDPKLPEDTLAVLSGVALHSIIKCKEYATYTIVHSEAGELTDGASFETPEKIVMTNSNKMDLLESVSDLSQAQKWLIAKIHFEDEPMSYRQIIAMINANEKLKEMVEKECKVTQVYLQQLYHDAIRRLKGSRKIRDMGYKDKVPEAVEVVPASQATDEELSAAVADGYIFDLD